MRAPRRIHRTMLAGAATASLALAVASPAASDDDPTREGASAAAEAVTVPPDPTATAAPAPGPAEGSGDAGVGDVATSDTVPATAPIDVAAPAPGARSPHVALARFTSAVENREPIDSVSFLPNAEREVVFFTDLRHLAGATVVHRWEYDGRVMAEVPFEVGSERWRVWSTKSLQPDWVGDWTASVVGPGGEVLAVETFTYQAPQ